MRWYATGTDIEDRKLAEQCLQNENTVLREEVDRLSMFEEIVGSCEPMRQVLKQQPQARQCDVIRPHKLLSTPSREWPPPRLSDLMLPVLPKFWEARFSQSGVAYKANFGTKTRAV